jgi:hypothetical protein
MKHVKMIGLAAVAAVVVTAFAGTTPASATKLCRMMVPANSGECRESYGTKTMIHAVNEGTAALTTAFKTIECGISTIEGEVTNSGSGSATVSGPVTTLSFGTCNCEVKVIKKGSLEVHWIPLSQNGTLTSSGAEVTASCSTIFGTVHCIYATSATDLGTLTGGAMSEGKATMDIESQDIPRLTTNGLCDETANWDTKYEVTSPKPLYVGDF